MGLSQEAFAEQLGVTQGHLSAMERGVRSLAYQVGQSLTKCYPGLSIDWLLSGRGDMALNRIALTLQSTGNPVQVNDDLVQVSTVLEVNEPPAAYGSVTEELSYLRKRIKQLEQFISQKFPDFPDAPTQ